MGGILGAGGSGTGLTCTVTTKIFTTCSISLKGLRPLARNLSQGLMKKYLRRRRRSSSSGGVEGAGEAPVWVPYPGLGVRSRSVSVRWEGGGSGDQAMTSLPANRGGRSQAPAKKTLRDLRKTRKFVTFYRHLQQCWSKTTSHLKEPELIPGPASGHSASLSLSCLNCKMGQ